jgi:hypothetical protein
LAAPTNRPKQPYLQIGVKMGFLIKRKKWTDREKQKRGEEAEKKVETGYQDCMVMLQTNNMCLLEDNALPGIYCLVSQMR